MEFLILDDNVDALANLTTELLSIQKDYEIRTYTDPENFKREVKIKNKTILFIDIFMPKESGIDVANEILEKFPNIPIIFFSGQPKNTFDVYDARHIYFLEKPFDKDKLQKAIQVASAQLTHSLFIYKKSKRELSIPMDKIIYFESLGRKIKIVTTGKESDIFYSKLNEIEKQIVPPFKRISQSYIINPIFIKKIEGYKITLKKTELREDDKNKNSNEIILYMTPKYKDAFKDDYFND